MTFNTSLNLNNACLLKKLNHIFIGDSQMPALKELLSQELDKLNEEQLKEVSDFIAFLKFRSRNISWQIDKNKMSAIYNEFAQEDRQLAEAGLEEYAELLTQEDLK